MPALAPDLAEASPPARFPSDHPWDRNFHVVLLTAAWTGILMGFGSTISRHVAENQPPYPFITHVHAAVFMGWLVLFTMQVLLIRWRNLKVHRQLGFWMAGIALVMIFLGPATALHKQHLTMGQPGADPAFLSIQLTDLIAFAGLTGTGLLQRRNAAVHRRLMLLGTLYITDAGFARWRAQPMGRVVRAHHRPDAFGWRLRPRHTSSCAFRLARRHGVGRGQPNRRHRPVPRSRVETLR